MLDIKNMTDDELINLIKLLKHELETRRTNKPYMFPTGVIKLTLESSITNDKGQVFQNEPTKIFYETASSKDIDAIFNQNSTYPIMVNQLVEKFKEGMWENQTGPLRLTRDETHRYRVLNERIKYFYPNLNKDDLELLDKVSKILGGK